MPRRTAHHTAAETLAPDEPSLPATETGPWSGGADGVRGACGGAGWLTRGGLSGCALPRVLGGAAAGDDDGAADGAGTANEAAGVAAGPGAGGRNPMSVTGAREGS